MEKEVIYGNQLIAIFDGCKWIGEDHIHDRYTPIAMTDQDGFLCHADYHEDWNKLMAVVEKIASTQTKDEEIIRNGEDSYFSTFYPRTFGMINSETKEFMVRINRFPLHQSKSLIEATWLAVIEFIKWHNDPPLP